MKLSKDKIWSTIEMEAEQATRNEPGLSALLEEKILQHSGLKDAVVHEIIKRLSLSKNAKFTKSFEFKDAIHKSLLEENIILDLTAIVDRDSACNLFCTPLLFYKGFLSLQIYRIANILWASNHQISALLLQTFISEHFAVDIHPKAKIGIGVMLDHATGIVIGETAVVEDNVSIMQSVTLGGTGKNSGDRHPKIRRNVLLGPQSTILGNIEIGESSMVGAASVVLDSVPPRSIVAGVPARKIGDVLNSWPSQTMNQIFSSNDST